MVDPMNPLGGLALKVSVPSLVPVETPSSSDRSGAAKPTPSPPSGPGPSAPRPSPQEVREAAEEVGTFLKRSDARLELQQVRPASSDLAFQVDQDTGIAFFKVIDSGTRKVIRQVPSEEVLAMAKKLRELSADASAPPGVLVNKEG